MQLRNNRAKKNAIKLICNYCGSSFVYKSSLQTHVNRKHFKMKPLKNFECTNSEANFENKKDLEDHMSTEHAEIQFNGQIEQDSKEIENKIVKKKAKEVICHDCGSTFSNKYCLQTHVKRKHMETKPLNKEICNECEASYENKTKLEHHMNSVHLNVKPYKCDSCPKSFTINSFLKMHIERYGNSGYGILRLDTQN